MTATAHLRPRKNARQRFSKEAATIDPGPYNIIDPWILPKGWSMIPDRPRNLYFCQAH